MTYERKIIFSDFKPGAVYTVRPEFHWVKSLYLVSFWHVISNRFLTFKCFLWQTFEFPLAHVVKALIEKHIKYGIK